MKGSDYIFAALALAVLAAAAPDFLATLRATRERYGLRREGRAVTEDALRRQVAEAVPPGADLFFVTSADARETTAERAARQAAAWEMMPAPVRHGPPEAAEGADAILSPRFDSEAERLLATLATAYRLVPAPSGIAETGRALRLRADFPARPLADLPTAPGTGRELLGLVPPALVLLGGGCLAGMAGMLAATALFSVLLMLPALAGAAPPAAAVSTWLAAAVSVVAARVAFPHGRTALTWAAALAGTFFALLAFLSLAHAFVTPYGLAISGGKAKLWYLSGGLLGTHFTDPSWSVLEPAYPPGHASLALGCYAVARGCGDWLTQLLVCPFAALAAAVLVARADGLPRKAWVASFFLLPVALMPASQFYPDPILTLFVLVGWEHIRSGEGCLPGWVLLGTSGWFKNEGAVFLFAAWLAWRLVGGGGRARLRDLAAALALPAAWHVGCRLVGARLNDYAAPWELSPVRGGKALCEALRLAFLRPAGLGFAYPAAVVAAAAAWRQEGRCPPPLRAALAFAGLSVLAFGAIYACGTLPDLGWHLRTSLPRLLWTPALVLAGEVARLPRGRASGRAV